MHWIYILECHDIEDGFQNYYVGETTRLYKRWLEHDDDKCLNTSNDDKWPVALYKKNNIGMFIEYNEIVNNIINNNNIDYSKINLSKSILDNWNFNEKEYDHLNIENNIVECLIIHNNDINIVRGGKYVKFNCNYEFPKNNYIKELPLCKCGLPCDVKKNDKNNYLYFRCSKKNFWDSLRESFGIDSEEDKPCKFFKEYINDKIIKNKYYKIINDRSVKLSELFKKSKWLNYITNDSSDPYDKCVGGCNKLNHEYKYIKYNGLFRTLCIDCFIDKNKELSKKYSPSTESKYMFID